MMNNNINEKVMTGLGQAIRYNRERCSLSQNDLGRKTGLSSAFVSMLERDKRTPSVGALTRIAACFGIKPSDLLEAAGEANERFELAKRLNQIVMSDDTESLKKLVAFAQRLERSGKI